MDNNRFVPEFKFENGIKDWSAPAEGMFVDFHPVEIGIIARKENEYLDRCIVSIKKFVPQELYKLRLQIDGTKTEAENFNELYSTSKSDYFIYLNDDVEILCKDWFFKMLWVLKVPQIAVAMPALVIDGFYRRLYLSCEQARRSFSTIFKEMVSGAVGGECYAIARYKIPDLRYDEKLLQYTGFGYSMCDVDFILQVNAAGYQSVRVHAVPIYHAALEKMDRYPSSTYAELRDRDARSAFYMARKWGEMYTKQFPAEFNPANWEKPEDGYLMAEKYMRNLKSRC